MSQNASGAVHIPEIGRCTSLYDLKHPDERGKGREAAVKCHVRNGIFGIDQQLSRLCDPFLVHIFIEGYVCELFKQSGEIKFAEAAHIRDVVQIEIFGAVRLDIITDVQKFLHIFFLLADYSGAALRTAGMVSSDQGDDLKELAVDHDLGKGGSHAEIFLFDLDQQFSDSPVDSREVLRGDENQRGKDIQQGFNVLHKPQRCGVRLKDDAPAGPRGIQRMDTAGTDQDDIVLPQDMGLVATFHGIDIFRGHDDLHSSMPVGRVILVFIIVIQFEGGALLIIDSLENAVQGFDHNRCSFLYGAKQ